MNIPQRIVLILGAITLLIVLATTGTYQHGQDGKILQANLNDQYANLWDWHTALVRGLLVSVATISIYFAVGKRK